MKKPPRLVGGSSEIIGSCVFRGPVNGPGLKHLDVSASDVGFSDIGSWIRVRLVALTEQRCGVIARRPRKEAPDPDL